MAARNGMSGTRRTYQAPRRRTLKSRSSRARFGCICHAVAQAYLMDWLRLIALPIALSVGWWAPPSFHHADCLCGIWRARDNVMQASNLSHDSLLKRVREAERAVRW